MSQSSSPYRAGVQALSRDPTAAEALLLEAIAGRDNRADARNALAVLSLRQGDGARAEILFREALAEVPASSMAHFNLGQLLRSQGRLQEAIDYFTRAVAQRPSHVPSSLQLARCHVAIGQFSEALATLEAAIGHLPGELELLCYRAELLLQRKQYSQAIQAYRDAQAVGGDSLTLTNNLAWTLQCAGQSEEAIRVLEELVEKTPRESIVWRNLAGAYERCGRFVFAEHCLRHAQGLNPSDSQSGYQYGYFLFNRGRLEEAKAVFISVLRQASAHADACNMLGNIALKQQEAETAQAYFRRAITQNDHDPGYFLNLAVAHRALRQYSDARTAFHTALRIDRNCADAHFGLGMLELLTGNFEVGWQHYEWRLQSPLWSGIRELPFPRWRGEALNRKRVFVHAEQGYGDTIQFVRYLRIVKAQYPSSTLVLAVDPALSALFAQVGLADELVTTRMPPCAVDFEVSLMSVPAILGTTLKTIPVGTPYICLNGVPAASKEKRRIGFAWRGRATHVNDFNRSCQLRNFLTLIAQYPDIEWVSLQIDLGDDERFTLNDSDGGQAVIDGLSGVTDFLETARVLRGLDLVISVDTAIVHLAGAMQSPVWTLLPFDPDWRWLLDRSDSPWYPSMRLFRQVAPGDWGGVMKALDDALRVQVALWSTTADRKAPKKSAQSQVNALVLFENGSAALANGKFSDAVLAFESALANGLTDAAVYNNLGNALWMQGRFEDSIARYLQALEGRSDSPQILTHLGVSCMDARRIEEATDYLARAVAISPEYVSANWNFSLLRLLKGEFREGWAAYEWRLKLPRVVEHQPPKLPPRWQGQALDGEKLLVYAEQGLGDTLQFIRFIPELTKRGATPVVVCQPELRSLLATGSRFGKVTAFGEKVPRSKFSVPLLSLPHLLGVGSDIATRVPYLQVIKEMSAQWQARLAKYCGLKIGLVWAGSPRPEDVLASSIDRRRSLPLYALSPILDVKGCQFFSLQKGAARDELKSHRYPIIDLADELNDFAETAALIENLDLTISVDTSVVHVCGGLGTPVWMLSRFDGCWRWLLDREDSPWYPSLRIFRQSRPGEWQVPINEIATALASLSSKMLQP